MDKFHAKKILQESRKEIDQIDRNIIELISKRTDLATKILDAKIALDMNIEDNEREKIIHEKASKAAKELQIDEYMLNQIIKLLTDINKQKQEEILKRK
jgi:chorismate mutase